MDKKQLLPLQFLTRAPSKEAVNTLFLESFKHRNGEIPTNLIAATQKLLSTKDATTAEQTKSLLLSIRAIVKYALYNKADTPQEIKKMFPAGFHAQLLGLIGAILVQHSPTWRKESIATQVGLPRLNEVDWRIDIKTASERGRMNVPTVIVNLEVDKTRTHVDQEPGTEEVTFEVGRAEFETMLEGLSKIRDQLNNVAGK